MEENQWQHLGDFKFNTLTKFFSKCKLLKSNKKKDFCLKFFSTYLFPTLEHRKDAFLVMRLLVPQIDRERPNFGLKEKNLARLISKSFGLSKDEENRLKHYKNPAYHPPGAAGIGDFVFVAQSVVSPLCSVSSNITLSEISDLLDELSSAQNLEARIIVFSRILKRISAADFEWITKIILKDLKIGLKHEKVLQLFHPDALNYFNSVSNLKKVCEECFDPSVRIQNTLFQLFVPIRPYLAKRHPLAKIRHFYEDKTFLIENKYDGERIQLHFDETSIKMFSRNCFEATSLYLPHLDNVIRTCIKADSAILDGEMIVVKKENFEPVPFGQNRAVAQSLDHKEFQLCCKLSL